MVIIFLTVKLSW